MRAASWMLAQLEFATRAHHVAADAGRITLLSGAVTRERYEEYLAKVFQFEAPIEARWQKIIGLESVIELKPRLRAGFLISDLSALGLRIESTPVAELVGVEQALGWMYVVERGRRMNALLYRHLVRRLPQQMAVAGNYLNASSPCGERWQGLGAALDKFANNHAIVEQIINAAHRAFRAHRGAPRFTPHATRRAA